MTPEEIIRQRRNEDKFKWDERYKSMLEMQKKYGKDSPEAKATAEEYANMLKQDGQIEAREGRRKEHEQLQGMLKDTPSSTERSRLENIGRTGNESGHTPSEYNEGIKEEVDDFNADVQFDDRVAEQELLKEEGVLPESITQELLMAGGDDEFDDVPEREEIAANAKVLPKSLTPELLMAEDDSESPMSAISVLRKMDSEKHLPEEKRDKPNGVPRVDTSDLMSDMDMGVDDLDLGNEGQYSDSVIAEEEEEEERKGGFRKPTYRSTHHERTKSLPPSKLAEKMQANKERRQMKRLMRKTVKGRRNAK